MRFEFDNLFVNIYDVAKLSGVSIATASKALNGRRDVREETRTRVQEIAKQLNYHPSHMARGLAKRCSENIGVLTLRQPASFFSNPLYSRVIEGMEMDLTRENYNLLFTVIPQGEAGYPKMVREKNVDGLCLVGEIPESLLKEVDSRGIPTVMVDCHSHALTGPFVVCDNAAGMRAAVAHLLSLGHSKLAFVGSDLPNFNFTERRVAFELELASAGLKAWPGLDLEEEGQAGSTDALNAWLLQADRPSAVICCNDEYALRVLDQAAKLGIRVPHDLSVIGFDDIERASASHPALTTLHVEKQEMGARAIRAVLGLIGQPNAGPRRVDAPVQLIVRSSTAQAPR